MKIADSSNIKSGEKDLIDSITADLDWDSLERLIEEKHHFKLQEDVEYKSGDMLVYDKQVAYKLDFDLKVSLSVIFDRNGHCLNLETHDQEFQNFESHDKKTNDDEQKIKQEKLAAESKVNGMASQIADMINDINKD